MPDKKTFTPDQIPGLKQASEFTKGRAYPEYVAPDWDIYGESGIRTPTGKYYIQYVDPRTVDFYGEGGTTVRSYINPKDLVFKDEPYYDQEFGVYGTQNVAYSTGQSLIDEALKDPNKWVSSNLDWSGLGHGGNFSALDEQMKFLKDNKYDMSTLPNQGAVNHYNLTKQILDQGTTTKWSGQGYGGPVENAKVMAGMLANTGIKDIKDFGKFNGVVSRFDQYVYPKDPADPSKGYVYDEPSADGEGWTGRRLDLPKDTPIRQQSMWDNDGGSFTNAIASMPVYGETFGNKVTKQSFVDAQNYNMAHGDIFSGTYIGDDRTNYGVQFAADGTPYFYTQHGGDTSSMGDIMPIVSIGLSLFAPGLGTAIGTALGATGVAASVIGSAIVQGTMAELSGGDFKDGALKGAIGAGVAPVVANTVGSAVADAMGDSAFNKVVTNAVTSASTAAVSAGLTGNGDIGEAALNAAVASIGGTYGKELGGDTGARIGTALGKIATGADAEQVLTSTIMDTLKSTVKDALKDSPTKDVPKDGAVKVAEADVTVPGADDLQNILDGSSGTQLASSDNDAALSAIEDLRNPAGTEEDPLLGLSSAEVGQGELDAITGAGTVDTVEGGVSTDTSGADSVAGGTETAPVTTGPMGPMTEATTKRYSDEFARYLDSLAEGDKPPPKYNVQDLGITDENWDSFNANLKKMLDDGNLPTQWKPGADGTFTFTGDDGDTLTIDADGKILGSTDAPKGNLISDTVTDPAVTKPVTTTGGGTTSTTTNTTTKAADDASGVDILSLLALMGGEQRPVQQKPEVNDDPFVAFDFNRPFQVNPFAQNPPTPRMAEGGSIDELLELLQYRGQT
jgi:hypothetical protein